MWGSIYLAVLKKNIDTYLKYLERTTTYSDRNLEGMGGGGLGEISTHKNYCCHPWSHQEIHPRSFASSIPACNITWSLCPWAGDLLRERKKTTTTKCYRKVIVLTVNVNNSLRWSIIVYEQAYVRQCVLHWSLFQFWHFRYVLFGSESDLKAHHFPLY